ncbi:MAG: respiratory nitrate reductase subunit gamma [Chloroflexi bacterium]|nr:respiratory nitrate reductase subunit gamma [Chloroflexota bacterium]
MHQLFQTLSVVPENWRLLFYGAGIVAILLALFTTIQRISLWSRGKDQANVLEGKGTASLLWLSVTRLFSADCLLAGRVFNRSRLRGFMLLFIVWSVLLLLFGVLLSAIQSVLGVTLVKGQASLYLSLVMDIAGGLLLVGLLIALARRYLFRPEHWISIASDAVVMNLFAGVVLMGFILEGMRLAALPWAAAKWTPVGYATGHLLAAIPGVEATSLITAYPAAYVLHAALAFLLIAYFPFSKLFHLFAAQITLFAAIDEGRGISWQKLSTPR